MGRCIVSALILLVFTTTTSSSSRIDSFASTLKDIMTNISHVSDRRRMLWARGTGALQQSPSFSDGMVEEKAVTMPRWKQDMLKNTTKGQWKKWLANENSPDKVTTRKPVIRSSGDVWKECGALPKLDQKFDQAPKLGNLPK
jgi:hypothetical protein